MPDKLRLGVCCMLTESDKSKDGEFRTYLKKTKGVRDCDPELFDWLKKFVVNDCDRCTKLIESSDLLASAKFQSSVPSNGEFDGCDLVFFDPDNAQRTFATGASILIYQHFNRQKRDEFIEERARELQNRTGSPAVVSFRTPHVVFLLASQDRHAGHFRQLLALKQPAWTHADITGRLHLGLPAED